jgi:hypothetical protein
VRVWDAGAAAEVESGRRILTDSRGLPLEASATVHAGSIIRLLANRERAVVDDSAE